MKQQVAAPWVRTVKNAEYALDYSGSLMFMFAMYIASQLLECPSYVRIFFSVFLLLCLVPKLALGIHRSRPVKAVATIPNRRR